MRRSPAPRSWLGRTLRSIITLHGRPEDIALGAAIGMFVAFTPTLGFQIILAAFLATLLRASRPAAIIPVWITNPLTMAPIFAFTYTIGAWFWPGPDAPIEQVYHLLQKLGRDLAAYDVWELWDQFKALLRLGVGLFIPMLIGGIIVGALAGAATYPATLWLVRGAQAARDAARQRQCRRQRQR